MNTLLVSFLVATVALTAVYAVPAQKASQSNVTAEQPSSSNATAAPNLANAMVDLLTAFRKIMPCGDASLNIPILAPLRIDNIPIDVDEELLTMKGQIKDLVIIGINDFVIINMASNSSNNRTTYDVIYKGFQFLGEFDVAVNADLAGYRFIQTLKGLMDLQLLNVRITGGVTIGVNEVGGMLFSDLDYYAEVGSIIDDTLEPKWSVAVNNFVHRYLSDSAMLFLQTNREFVSEMISGYVTPIINNALYNISSSEYIHSLVEATELYDSIDCSP